MTQVYKSMLNKGLIEFSVMRNSADAQGYFQVEYKIYSFCDKRALLHEFSNAVTTYLDCLIERNEQDADHGYLYLIPAFHEDAVREVCRC